jgi:hypothetical protein
MAEGRHQHHHPAVPPAAHLRQRHHAAISPREPLLRCLLPLVEHRVIAHKGVVVLAVAVGSKLLLIVPGRGEGGGGATAWCQQGTRGQGSTNTVPAGDEGAGEDPYGASRQKQRQQRLV